MVYISVKAEIESWLINSTYTKLYFTSLKEPDNEYFWVTENFEEALLIEQISVSFLFQIS